MTDQMMTANATQAPCHCHREMKRWMSGGKTARLATAPSEERAMARPRNRTNHRATRVVPMSDRAPCPSVRMAANPAYSSRGLSTWLIHSAAKPNRIPTAIISTRAPRRSSIRPTRTMTAAAVSEPAVYSPETSVRDQEVSLMMGSTKTETE